MFDGKMKSFRMEGGIVKTEDEKRQMAEKHRFKKNREFKQRLDEQEENEDSDIRSFTFHRHELEPRKAREPRKPREPKEPKNSRDSRDSRGSRKPKSPRKFSENHGGHEHFDRSGGNRKNNKRYNSEHED